MTPAPRVSVIVRSMDRPWLARALASLARQTCPSLEILVVDATGGRHRPLPPPSTTMVQAATSSCAGGRRGADGVLACSALPRGATPWR